MLVCAVLGGERQHQGIWRFRLAGQVKATPRYRRNTPILVTRLEAEDGSAVDVIDFCPRFERSGRMFRPVAFVRIVRAVAGSPRIEMEMVPMRDYGAEVAATTRGTNHIRYLRSEERRVGKECVSTCRSRWSREQSKTNIRQ